MQAAARQVLVVRLGREAVPLVNCEAWKPRIQELWKDAGKHCRWGHLRAPRMVLLFDGERATNAVLYFLRKSKVGQMNTVPSPLGT